ncbi:Tyr recombinase domain-containing protein [uncultured Thiomicrorhabdus sp.]
MTGKISLNCDRPPKYCYFRHGRWVYVHYQTGKKMKEIPLRSGRKLLREDATCAEVHSLVEAMKDSPSDTIQFLLDRYLKSDYAKKLSENTLKGYGYYYQTLVNMPMKNGRTFGEMPFELVTPGIITRYLDKRISQGVSTVANREIELLSAAFNWSIARDYAKKNPCNGVRHLKEIPKKKYITDEEYVALLHASKGKPLYFAAEITYLCRARGVEAWNLTLSHIDDSKGVFIERTKGSLPEWTVWTDRLRKVIDGALSLRKQTIKDLKASGRSIPKTDNLLITRWGKPYSKSARDSAWQSAYKKLVSTGVASMNKEERFSFHDIKAKGVSDHALHESGHKTESAKARYMRKTKEVEATK